MSSEKTPEKQRHFTHGAGGAMADAATDAAPRHKDHLPDSPSTRPAPPLAEDEKPDQLADKEAVSEDREEARIDEGIEESFLASDPVSGYHIT